MDKAPANVNLAEAGRSSCDLLDADHDWRFIIDESIKDEIERTCASLRGWQKPVLDNCDVQLRGLVTLVAKEGPHTGPAWRDYVSGAATSMQLLHGHTRCQHIPNDLEALASDWQTALADLIVVCHQLSSSAAKAQDRYAAIRQRRQREQETTE